MHSQGIVHRDLKPENILFLNNEPNAPLKIVDFGTACKFPAPGEKLTENHGTIGFQAPEMLEGSYAELCDIFSAGIINYQMLAGIFPFEMGLGPMPDSEINNNILRGRVYFPKDPWMDLSIEVK